MPTPEPQPNPRRTGRLGDGLDVSPMGLGCMVLTGTYAVADRDEAVATFHRAIELGVTFLDTADAYGGGDNERFLGTLLAPVRDRVVVASKFGLVHRAGEGAVIDSRPERAAACCDASLLRLGIDHLDLYYAHRIDRAVPLDETIGAMAALVHAGKVRHLGVCELDGDELRRACAVHPIAALQSEWSLWARDIERDALPAARALGVGIVPYGPLGRGFLTGAIAADSALDAADVRGKDPRFAEHRRANLGLVEELRLIAAANGASPAQIALAWLLAQGDDVVPIPGVEKRTYLYDDVGALDVVLDAAQLDRLGAVFAPGAALGDADDVHMRRR